MEPDTPRLLFLIRDPRELMEPEPDGEEMRIDTPHLRCHSPSLALASEGTGSRSQRARDLGIRGHGVSETPEKRGVDSHLATCRFAVLFRSMSLRCDFCYLFLQMLNRSVGYFWLASLRYLLIPVSSTTPPAFEAEKSNLSLLMISLAAERDILRLRAIFCYVRVEPSLPAPIAANS